MLIWEIGGFQLKNNTMPISRIVSMKMKIMYLFTLLRAKCSVLTWYEFGTHERSEVPSHCTEALAALWFLWQPRRWVLSLVLSLNKYVIVLSPTSLRDIFVMFRGAWYLNVITQTTVLYSVGALSVILWAPPAGHYVLLWMMRTSPRGQQAWLSLYSIFCITKRFA